MQDSTVSSVVHTRAQQARSFHGACTMFRRECLLQLGGYAEQFNCQDGYDIWLKFIQRFQPYNVNIPLFYYRQHPASLTRSRDRLLNARQQIKRNFVSDTLDNRVPRTLGVVPVVSDSVHFKNPFQQVAGKVLLDYQSVS